MFNKKQLETMQTLAGVDYIVGFKETDNRPVKMDVDLLSSGGGGGSLPYTAYNAVLNQSGSDAPAATVLQDDLGGTPVWSYNSTGDYTCTVTGALTVAKTQVFIGHQGYDSNLGDVGNFSVKNLTVNGFTLEGYEAGGGGQYADDLLVDVPIEIRVWP